MHMQPSTQTVHADGLDVFYRQAGSPSAPPLLLLHGFPSSSFQYRNLLPLLADRYRVIAPDLPGFGFTRVPPERGYRYTFAALSETVSAFTEALGFDRFGMYVFDYGAPTGFRMALQHPERIAAIITQNGNAYEDGLGNAWAPIQCYWKEPTSENREALRSELTFEAIRSQYTDGAPNPERIAPEGYVLDAALLTRPGNADIQLDLFRDYATNVALYPQFQRYFREAQPPLLAVWGRNDAFFPPAGAEAFRRDLPHATVQLLDAGHFALETHAEEIAAAIRVFLEPLSLG